MDTFQNPFRPGAGQLPPHLAGRQNQIDYFEKNSLTQSAILTNLIISGLRGVGKTVLLDTLRPHAIGAGWMWAGADLSESVSVSEKTLSIRILADLASACSSILITKYEKTPIGFTAKTEKMQQYLNHDILNYVYQNTPGLEADKLKKVIEFAWANIKLQAKGIVLAYDEAQNLKDNAADKQYPLSLLLEVVQYIQRQQFPVLLILTGLPTLFPNLVETRTYAERMFHQMILHRLTSEESREAIEKPIQKEGCPVKLSDAAIDQIIQFSGGYPYFIQYICKEIYDMYLQQLAMGNDNRTYNFEDVIRKLDSDFYQGRWNKVTDRQRDLLSIIANLDNAEEEFTIKEIEEESLNTDNPFKRSPINLMLKSLSENGLIYKNRHGKYSFAVPLFSQFIKRESATE